MRVAIVHDWMTLRGGGETVVEYLLGLFPDADLFCVVDFLPDHERGFLKGRRITTSFIQRLPRARSRYRAYLPLMPIAVEQFDLTGYDLVISSSSAVAKGVITGPGQMHIAYVHTPIRYAWDLQHQYMNDAKMRGIRRMIAAGILHYMRIWDMRTTHGVDRFIANSAFVAQRIRKFYGRSATVIYPPVDLDRFALSEARDDVYVSVSRLVPYKRIPLIAEAFRRMPDRRLVVIGDGPDMAALRAAAGSNVTIMGKQSDAVVTEVMARARAFVFAAEEDFGIAPVEAQACGTPVIAYGRGGALETVRGRDEPGRSGVFFAEQTAEAIVDAVERFEAIGDAITPAACRASAERFGAERFRTEIGAFIADTLARGDNTRPLALAGGLPDA